MSPEAQLFSQERLSETICKTSCVAGQRTVFAVCSDQPGFPPEVYALFETEEEAKRFVEGAYFRFVIVPLAVYETYDDCPEDERFTDSATLPSRHLPSG